MSKQRSRSSRGTSERSRESGRVSVVFLAMAGGLAVGFVVGMLVQCRGPNDSGGGDAAPAPMFDRTPKGATKVATPAFEQALERGDPFAASIPDETGITVRLEPHAVRRGEIDWIGRLPGDDCPEVSLVSRTVSVGVGPLTRRRVVFSADVWTPEGGQFEIAAEAGLGNYRIRSIDPTVVDVCLGGKDVEYTIDPKEVIPTAGAREEFTFDLVVAYTKEAEKEALGQTGMELLIQRAVANANWAYSVSGIRTTLKLVGTLRVEDAELGDTELILDALTQAGDNVYDAALDLRDRLRANLLALIVSKQAGRANHMGQASHSFGPKACSVVSRLFAASRYQLAHEIGHNMGCCHERANARTCAAPKTYAHGFDFPPPSDTAGSAWSTILSVGMGVRCCHFSNPKINYFGMPTGDEVEANNSLLINENAPVVARWNR